MADPVSGKPGVCIGPVFPPGLLRFLEVGLDFPTCRLNQGADDVARDAAHGYQPPGSGPPKQVIQEGLDPVVPRMPQGELGKTLAFHGFLEESVPRRPGCGFQVARVAIGLAPMLEENQIELPCQFFNEPGVIVGFLPSPAMVDVGQTGFEAKFPQDMNQAHRICPARYSDEQGVRTGEHPPTFDRPSDAVDQRWIFHGCLKRL